MGGEAESVAELCGEQRHEVLKLRVALSGLFFCLFLKKEFQTLKKKDSCFMNYHTGS